MMFTYERCSSPKAEPLAILQMPQPAPCSSARRLSIQTTHAYSQQLQYIESALMQIDNHLHIQSVCIWYIKQINNS